MGNQDPITHTPYNYSSYIDTAKPQGYVNSDLKDLYLSREQLNARKTSPAITQAQLFKNLMG